MRIMGLAATAALMAAAGGSAALACEAPGACAYAPASDAYVFQPPGPMRAPMPEMRGPAVDAYVFSPGPTPAYAAGEERRGDEGESYDRYGGEYHGEHEHGRHDEGARHHRGGEHEMGAYSGHREGHEHGGYEGGYRDGGRYGLQGGMRQEEELQRYGAVGRAEGYLAPYTPAFGRGVVTERPYAGAGYGYRIEHRGCNTGCGAARYRYGEVEVEEGRPVQVGPDFFYGGINGGAGYGVDGGGWGGGGGFFADSGFGASATQAFSRSNAFASAGAHASAHAFAFSYGGHGKTMKHGGCNCGGKSMGHGGGKH